MRAEVPDIPESSIQLVVLEFCTQPQLIHLYLLVEQYL